jgi:hypothetical protein
LHSDGVVGQLEAAEAGIVHERGGDASCQLLQPLVLEVL